MERPDVDTGSSPPELGDPSLILERMNEGFYAIDRDWRLVRINRSAELFWGRPRADMLGRDMRELFPRFKGSPSFEAHNRAFETGEYQGLETISTANGAPVELRIFPFPGGLSIFFLDITRRYQMEEEVRERDETLTLAELSAGIGIWVADLKAGTVRGTPQFFRLMGLEPVLGPVSLEIPRQVRHPLDRERVTRGFQEALASGSDVYEVEYRIIRPSGEERWIFGRGRVLRDANGVPWRYSGIDIDITERKRQDEHLRVVSRELVHRTNNLLAIIQAIVRQTALASSSTRDFEARLTARIRGLGDSNAILVREEWRGASLRDLIRAQLAPFIATDESRVELVGDPIFLSPRSVQNVGLALHELATNATKYGALSIAGGRVRIDWSAVDGDGAGAPHLRITWKESGGPPVKARKRRGFGSAVMEEVVARALGGEAVMEFDRTGVRWSIDLPETEFRAVPSVPSAPLFPVVEKTRQSGLGEPWA
jgi:PAS domain S-box-containing protein